MTERQRKKGVNGRPKGNESLEARVRDRENEIERKNEGRREKED